MTRWIPLAAVLVGVAVLLPGCGSDSESLTPLTCPDANSEAGRQAQESVKVALRSMNDELAMGDNAKLQVEPGAGLGGTIIICGRNATLIVRDKVMRAAVLGREEAKVVLQDNVEEPEYLEMTGKVQSKVRCNKENQVPNRPSCDSFFIS